MYCFFQHCCGWWEMGPCQSYGSLVEHASSRRNQMS